MKVTIITFTKTIFMFPDDGYKTRVQRSFDLEVVDADSDVAWNTHVAFSSDKEMRALEDWLALGYIRQMNQWKGEKES